MPPGFGGLAWLVFGGFFPPLFQATISIAIVLAFLYVLGEVATAVAGRRLLAAFDYLMAQAYYKGTFDAPAGFLIGAARGVVNLPHTGRSVGIGTVPAVGALGADRRGADGKRL